MDINPIIARHLIPYQRCMRGTYTLATVLLYSINHPPVSRQMRFLCGTYEYTSRAIDCVLLYYICTVALLYFDLISKSTCDLRKSRAVVIEYGTQTHTKSCSLRLIQVCTSAVVWGVCRADDFSAEFLGQNTACIHPIYVGVESNIKYTCSTAHVMHACVCVCEELTIFIELP